MESINHLTRLTAAFLGLTILVLGIAAIWIIRMRRSTSSAWRIIPPPCGIPAAPWRSF